MNFKRYDDAVKAFTSALKWIPNDQKAMQQLAQAQQLLQDAPKVKAPPPADPNKAFADAMQRGAAAEKKEMYADAVKAFTDAIKLRPKDQDANAGWRKNQFNLNMQQGQQYLDNMMWLDAQREFESALRLFPKDANALRLLQKAKNKGK
jgi:tetratricopeptide (TPR) repeat protein